MKKRKLAPAARPAVASKAHLAGEPKHVKKDKDLTDSTKSKSKTSRSSIKPTNFISMAEDPEDMEIARLEKLLGVSSKGEPALIYSVPSSFSPQLLHLTSPVPCTPTLSHLSPPIVDI